MSDDLAGRRDRPLKAEPDSVRDTPHAPIVFFEWAPASGFANGIISVTLGANCNTQVRPNGEVMSETLVVAHLRCSVQAAGSVGVSGINRWLPAARFAARKRAAGSGTVRASQECCGAGSVWTKSEEGNRFDCPAYERFLLTIASLEEPL